MMKVLVAARRSRKRAAARGAELGASLVEYAFILIIFLSLIMGISGFGHALFTYHHVNNVAKEGTRYATVRGSTCTNDGSCAAPATLSDVQAYIQGFTPPSIDYSKMTITGCGLSGQSACTESGPEVCSATVGSIPATPNYPGCTVKVTVSYPYNFMFPLIRSTTTITAPCTTAGFCMSSTSEMIIVH
jgi:Flp pilus assembly protein TadG